ncbi:MAG: glycosyltransferase [Candidatus Bathyarchaeales archaeon]
MTVITIGLCVRSLKEVATETIDSILNQDFPKEKLELVIVSSKHQEDIDLIYPIVKKRINVKFFTDKGKGLAVARQLVIENATGKYILWVDSDVVLSQDFVRQQLAFISKDLGLGVVIGEFKHKNIRGRFFSNVMSLYWCMLKQIYFGATLCRVEALNDVGGFDRRITGASEDTDLVFRLVAQCWKLAINPSATFVHKQRETMKDLLKKGIWYGYGGHFMGHKYASASKVIFRIPPIYFISGLKFSRKAYVKYFEKKAFLIPIVTTVFSVGWCLGLILGHLSGYGHSIKVPEVPKQKTAYILQKLRLML